MKIHILGICGTFMGGLAQLARELGHQVSGSDEHVYPPMSTQLSEQGIEIQAGYLAENLPADIDLFVVGNAISRGNDQIEWILDKRLPYMSGPQFLHDHLLRNRWVLAVAGTHGKTTTTGMLSWILEYAGLNPGFLVGGVTRDFGISARLGAEPFFVIEADEYDTAFFDKRSKFVHYAPQTLILNNLEFDHADIFENLAAIQKQFHHLLRIVPANGLIIHNGADKNLDQVIEMGCWSEQSAFNHNSSEFKLSETHLHHNNQEWDLSAFPNGHFNHLNACAALLAAQHAGVPIKVGVEALASFKGVKRRQEILAEINDIRIIDDFAHHPTAIAATLKALKPQTPGRLFAVFEPRSNSMKAGIYQHQLPQAFDAADQVLFYDNGMLQWQPRTSLDRAPNKWHFHQSTDNMVESLVSTLREQDQVVIMSNGGFDGIHQKLINALQSRHHGEI